MKQKTIYLEKREQPHSLAHLTSDIARHWQCRFAHSKALVICDEPENTQKHLERQWLRLTNQLQQKRLQTAGADEILELTYAITHMQNVSFAACPPQLQPSSHMWFIAPQETLTYELATSCRSIYITARKQVQTQALIDQLPAHALIIDYAHNSWPNTLQTKADLEDRVHDAWSELHTFFKRHDVIIEDIFKGDAYNADAIDNAIDILLDVSSSFLRHAHQFQEMVQLAEPLQVEHSQKQLYDAATLLARRVATLSPNIFGRFLSQALDNENFYLQGRSLELFKRESAEATVKYHYQAGRNNLARALERAFMEGTITSELTV